MASTDHVLQRRADEEISHRSTAGALALVVVAAGIYFLSGAVKETPHVAGPMLVSAMVVNAARFGLAQVFTRVYERSRRLWLGLFAGLGFFHALLWGVGSGYLIVYRPMAWSTLVLMLITAAMAAGATSSLAPSAVQMRIYVGLVLGPAVLFGFVNGRPTGITMGLMHAAYILYLWAHGTRNCRAHWNQWLTERRLEEANEQLRRANAEALEALQTKTLFLANMSHELRTPLHAALGTTQLLEASTLDANQREMVKTIRRSSEHLLSLLNDILDLSKVEAGKMVLEATPVDLRASIGEVVQLMTPLASRKGLELRFEFADALTGRFLVDPLRLRQVVSNLIVNGIKFTDRGQVTVTVSALAIEGPTFRARIEVRDTGVGIPADRLTKIFESFGQADASTARRFGGTGLGLSISRKLVDLMGGHLEVQSQVGVGSKFWFDLPLTRAAVEEPSRPGPQGLPFFTDILPAEPTPVRAHPGVNGPRILLAEDNPSSQRVLVAMLQHLGCDVEVAGDGLTAVERVERGHYDLAFVDCQMPTLDGYEAARRIRALPGARNRVALVALTANTLPGEETRCLEAGMDDYLAKPVRIADLKGAIERWLGPLPEVKPPASEASA